MFTSMDESSNRKRNEVACRGFNRTVMVHSLGDGRKSEMGGRKEHEKPVGKMLLKKTFRKKKNKGDSKSPPRNRPSARTAASDAAAAAGAGSRTDSSSSSSSPSADSRKPKTESQAVGLSHVKNVTRNLCSRAANNTKRKLHGLIGSSKNPIARLNVNLPTMRATASHHGFEITIRSFHGADEHGERLELLDTYKRAAGKRMGNVAQKLSSFRKSGDEKDDDRSLPSGDRDDGDGDDDATQIASEVSRECPICLGHMSDSDWIHPLQCGTPQCHYNFCSLCIHNLIKSSQDPYGEASDGSHQVKVHLRCPNCRCKLDKTLRRTLLLRTVDNQTLAEPERRATMLELSGVASPEEASTDEQKAARMDQVEMEVCLARAQEREFLASKPSAQKIEGPSTSKPSAQKIEGPSTSKPPAPPVVRAPEPDVKSQVPPSQVSQSRPVVVPKNVVIDVRARNDFALAEAMQKGRPKGTGKELGGRSAQSSKKAVLNPRTTTTRLDFLLALEEMGSESNLCTGPL